MTERFIRITSSLRHQILERYGCTPATVKAAMEFTTDTAFAKELRRFALEHGARVWVPEKRLPGDQMDISNVPGVER